MSAFITKLPINEYLPEIRTRLQSGRQLILQAEPGAGKSTAVPLYLLQNLDLQGKTILMLEPRRLAATSIATFLAKSLGEAPGQQVGFQIRNERKISRDTRLEIITEGILTARLQQEPELTGVGLVIFDEFHERSLHADLGLALCKEVQEGFNENLKLLVMSATLDSDELTQYLPHASTLQVPGRCFPVQTYYSMQRFNQKAPRGWQSVLVRTLRNAVNGTKGDVLVFLPGQREIKAVAKLLAETLEEGNYLLIELYSGLPSDKQREAILRDKKGRQKVILATNIAETSLTIENITCVIDSGLEKQAYYDPGSGMNRLVMQSISKASATQRCGRAGRLASGSCYRLWSESQQQALAEQTAPEITRSDLASLRLVLALWGVKEASEIDWLTAPPTAHYHAASALLQQLGLLDESERLTAAGERASRINLHPRLARILLSVEEEEKAVQKLAVDLVAVLGDAHFYRDREDADLLSRLMALHTYRQNRNRALAQFPITAGTIRLVQQTAERLGRSIFKFDSNQVDDQTEQMDTLFLRNQLGRLLSYGFPDRICKRRKQQQGEEVSYQLANGKGAQLNHSDPLSAAEWLVVADLDGRQGNGKIFLAATIDEEDLAVFPGFSRQQVYRYDEQQKTILAHEVTCLQAIELQRRHLQDLDTKRWQVALADALEKTQLHLLNFPPQTKKWLERLAWLREAAPEQTVHWADFSITALLQSKEEWLLPYLEQVDSMQALAKVDIDALLKARLDYQHWLEFEQQAPAYYITPCGKKVPITYQLGQLPKVSIPLQELFGQLESPALAWHSTRLSFELLSPAQRPIQTTSDLAKFWQGSYVDIAKEMRGRYPKHRWPENPLKEEAGQSLKTKN